MQREPMLKETFERLSEELNYLKSVERAKIAKAIDEARSLGDLKENAEYHSAKEKQSHTETRIIELGDILSRAQVVDPSKLSHKKVSFGSTVVLTDHKTDKEVTYTIVGTQEADPSNGFISIYSPLAQAMLGKEEGDEVEVNLPNGKKSFDIEEIKFNELNFVK
jgi:transcription elongation factor GreA